jgi:hypothetical protein
MLAGSATPAETRSLWALLDEYVELVAMDGELSALEQLAEGLDPADPLAVALADARRRLHRLHAGVLARLGVLLGAETVH